MSWLQHGHMTGTRTRLTSEYVIRFSEQKAEDEIGIACSYLQRGDNEVTGLEEIDTLSCSVLCERSVRVCEE